MDNSRCAIDKCWVYLLREGKTKFYKVGITAYLSNRISSIKREYPRVHLIHATEFNTRYAARRIEYALHQRLKDRRASQFCDRFQGKREWFTLTQKMTQSLRGELRELQLAELLWLTFGCSFKVK